MGIEQIVEVLRSDKWSLLEGSNDTGHYLLRFRSALLAPLDISGFNHVLKVVWRYADENTGAMPTSDDSEEMSEFEICFCEAVQRDAIAILTAVLTFDGARQWVFYTRDIEECARRLNSMPSRNEPFPLELSSEWDTEWSYLHDSFLCNVPRE